MTIQPDPRGAVALPSRALAPVLTPIFVFACTLGLIVWSAWPVLRPVRSLETTQAIYVQSSVQPTATRAQLTQSNKGEASTKSTRTVQAAGWLEAEPFYIAATALADGVVQEMLVLEGDLVKKGQVLARLVDADSKLRLANHEAELLIARSMLDQAAAHLVAAETNWESPFELERVVSSRQAALNEKRAELTQLPSLIETEEALLVLAQEELKNIQRAYERGVAAEIEFITARERANAQMARLEALQAREPILEFSVDQIESDLHAAHRDLELRIDDRSRLDSARASLRRAQAEVAQKEAQLDIAALEFERMTIYSPIDGYVQRRLKVPGDKVIQMMDEPHSAHIAHLYDPSKLQVRVDVPLADASQVFVGQTCEVVVEVLADQVFQGVVLRVTHEADLQKNTLQVKVGVVDPDPVLRPEMLTRVKFLPVQGASSAVSEPTLGSTVRVPEGSIDFSTGTEQVWVVTERENGQGILRPVSVNKLDESQGWATVQGLIQPGAMIAADPKDCVEGERVKLRERIGGV
jgi:HlyD family secretion protein